ncbi:MAG TPA: protein translocase subunit SecD [Anaerolineales bacterium]|nr:protein translocase subunit SecD [Anaerolineales bacterium]
MKRNQYRWLYLIIPLIALAIWVDVSPKLQLANPFKAGTYWVNRDVSTRLGLDLRGGLQVLLEADLPSTSTVNSNDLKTTLQILENRVNGLGVSEVVMQSAPPNRIVAEFPGLQDPQQVVNVLQETGVLEFVDFGSNPLAAGTVVQTDFGTAGAGPDGIVVLTPTSDATATTAPTDTPVPTDTATATASGTETAQPTSAATPTATATTEPSAPIIYHTVMTGKSLASVSVETGASAGVSSPFVISFALKSDATTLFGDYTGSHVGQVLGIVLDKKVISSPSINQKIDKGSGIIEGNFTQDEANALAIQLRYGSLPIPVKVVESQSVGATLGADSVRRSLIAGIIGLIAVVLFMLLYYRLPGFVADLALIVYALVSFMLFKFIPVVLTLPGIAGFILSVGMAVDANILIFERLKEELRAGRTLRQAIDLGWARAWPSIRDSNSSTLITCLILFIFGNTFGASMVKGFSVTLALGVLVSLFTAVIVTRTFLHVVLDSVKFAEHPRWFGI